MAKFELKLPKMGESVAEATITSWLKEVGDTVDIDESLVEIATDKVDSDVPSEFKGKLIKKNFEVNDVISPCGACRQVMAEYEEKQEEAIKVILHSPTDEVLIANTVEDLLPFMFKSPLLKKH